MTTSSIDFTKPCPRCGSHEIELRTVMDDCTLTAMKEQMGMSVQKAIRGFKDGIFSRFCYFTCNMCNCDFITGVGYPYHSVDVRVFVEVESAR